MSWSVRVCMGRILAGAGSCQRWRGSKRMCWLRTEVEVLCAREAVVPRGRDSSSLCSSEWQVWAGLERLRENDEP